MAQILTPHVYDDCEAIVDINGTPVMLVPDSYFVQGSPETASDADVLAMGFSETFIKNFGRLNIALVTKSRNVDRRIILSMVCTGYYTERRDKSYLIQNAYWQDYGYYYHAERLEPVDKSAPAQWTFELFAKTSE